MLFITYKQFIILSKIMYIYLLNIMNIMKYKAFVKTGETNLDPGEPGTDYLFYESRTHILPISELRDTSKISELADSAMVTVTKNGHSHLRILSESAYESLMDRLEFLEGCYAFYKMEQGKDGTPADEFIAELRAKHAL